MKKALCYVIAASFLLNTVPAAAEANYTPMSKTTQQINQKLHTLQVNIEGKVVRPAYVTKGSKKLVDATVFLQALGYKKDKARKGIISYSTKNAKITYDTTKKKLLLNKKSAAVTYQFSKSKLYIEPTSFLKATKLNYLFEEDGSLFVAKNYKILSQEAYEPQWITNNQLVISVSGENGIESKLLDITTRKTISLPTEFSLVVSPKKDRAIFTDEDGIVYELTFSTKQIRKVGDDIDPKTELKWSEDGKSIYFLGDKAKNYLSMNIAEGSVSTIFKDDAEGKTDITLSPTKSFATYIVAKSGKATEETLEDGSKEISGNDTTGTEQQVYIQNLTEKDAKPFAITSTKTNKEYVDFLGENKVMYLDIPEEETEMPKLNVYDITTKETKNLITNKNITLVKKLNDSTVIIGVTEAKTMTIYTIDVATKQLKTLLKVKDSVIDLSVLDAKNLALTLDNGTSNYVAAYRDGKLSRLTK